MKAVVAAFNQEKALVGAFSVITNLRIIFGWNFLKHYCAPITDHPSDQLQLGPDSVSLASANILGSGPADMHAMVDDIRQPLLILITITRC